MHSPLNGDWLSSHRVVAYYGNPLDPGLGVLGQGSPSAMLDRLQRQANAYAAADPGRPVQPALELITPTAQGSPGATVSTEIACQIASFSKCLAGPARAATC